MAYTEPKTDWNEAYEPSTQDMNRIEGNTKQNHEDIEAEESARIAAVEAEESARIAADNTLESEKAGIADNNTFSGDNDFTGIVTLSGTDISQFPLQFLGRLEQTDNGNFTLASINIDDIKVVTVYVNDTRSASTSIRISLPGTGTYDYAIMGAGGIADSDTSVDGGTTITAVSYTAPSQEYAIVFYKRVS